MINKTTYSSAIIIGLLVLFSLLFNNAVINIRLQEADYHLYKFALNQFTRSTFIISSKYNLIKTRIEKGHSSLDDYETEGQIQAILSEDENRLTEYQLTPLPKYHPVALSIQLIRTILGKEKLILPSNTPQLSRDLEIAYFLERHNNYISAIALYNDIISKTYLEPQLYTSILLHKAFCTSMLGDFEKAANIYDDISKKYPETEAGILSGRMKAFLESLIDNNLAIIASKKSDLLIGREYYLNINYDEALRYFNNEISNDDPKTKSEAHYYKGRVYEEQGKFKKAVYEYHKIMHLNRDSKWTREANRRLVMVNSIYNQNHPLAKSAEENLKILNDSDFLKSVKDIKEFIPEIKEHDSLKEKYFDKYLIEKDTLLFKKSTIADTEEETEDESNTVETPTPKPQKTEKRVFTKEEKIAMKKELANNKYRKALFIRSTIEQYTPKLQKIYLNYIKSGKNISGEIVVEMNIYSSGKINASITSSNIKNNGFTKKVLREINRWKFPALEKDLGVLTISYPFKFKK